MQDIDVHGGFKKSIVTLLVMRTFLNLSGASRACADLDAPGYFRDPTEVSRFKEGLTFYRQQAWVKAISSFTKALEANTNDKLCDTYIERCQHFQNNAPGDAWDGVWTMTSK